MLTLVRLVSGVELLGTIVKKNGEFITINNPLQINYVQRAVGAPSVSLQRYIPFTSQEDIILDWRHIETTCQPIQGLPEYYENALKIIKEHVDPSLVTDLMDANEGKPEKHNYDSYLAMLERYMSKKPLN